MVATVLSLPVAWSSSLCILSQFYMNSLEADWALCVLTEVLCGRRDRDFLPLSHKDRWKQVISEC